jgi:nucleotide-binding universal stress UspA family protein
MASQKILFCTDLSQYSDAALPLATTLAREHNAELIILHVLEPADIYAAGEWYYGPVAPDPDEVRKLLEKLKPTDPDIPCVHRLETGDPVKKIVGLAAAENVNIIVMSTHGRTGLTRALMGSIADGVVRYANCPVVVFKQPVPPKPSRK